MIETLCFRQTPKGDNLTLRNLWNRAEAVLFDFDGVLADSEPVYRKSWNRVFSEYSHSVSEREYWKHWAFLGEGLEGEIRRTGLRIPDREAARSKQKLLYTEFCKEGYVSLFPLAVEVVGAVNCLKKCAIASNTDSFLIRLILGSQLHRLPLVVGGEGLRPKPSPDIFLRASKLLSVKPSKCLVFEDALKGVKAAERAGIPVVLVRNRYNSDFSAPEASHEINGLAELCSFLQEVSRG
jgi:beta-phosphoglucomutase-like phosphatase (HAD superfamily)